MTAVMEREPTVGEAWEGRNLLASAISKETGIFRDEVVKFMKVADDDMPLDIFVDCMRVLREIKDGTYKKQEW